MLESYIITIVPLVWLLVEMIVQLGLSINAEIALLYGSLIEAYIFMKGEQDVMNMYNQKFQEALIGVKILGEARETTDEYRIGEGLSGETIMFNLKMDLPKDKPIVEVRTTHNRGFHPEER